MSSPSAAALVRTASEEERERKQQAEADPLSSLVEVREAETELADVQQQILALSPREEGECSAASTPTGAERSADASPRFSYANNHSSGRQHVRGSGVARAELLQLARDGTLWGDTMIRTDAQGGASPSAWRRFDDILRSPRSLEQTLGVPLGELCAMGYRSERKPRAATTGCDAPAAEEIAQSRRRAMTNIASSLTRQLFSKSIARSDLIGALSPSSSGAAQGGSAAAAPAAEKRLSPSIASMFMSDANLPRSSSQGEARPRAPAAGSRIVAGGKKLGVIASAVSSQLQAVAATASAAVPSRTDSSGVSAAAARAKLIGASTGLEYSPTTNSVRRGLARYPSPLPRVVSTCSSAEQSPVAVSGF